MSRTQRLACVSLRNKARARFVLCTRAVSGCKPATCETPIFGRFGPKSARLAVGVVMAVEAKKPLLVIIGATASGKSQLALEVAARTHAELLSVDSMQVYRHMDIGTAKPTAEEQRRVRHHLIDVVEP